MMMVKVLGFGRRQLHTIISRETIKPSSRTPSHLHTYNLSPIDQLADHKYVPMILFYPHNANCSLSSHHKAQLMKKSLSQSLSRYYPLAGRLGIPKIPSVNCNDEGVVFIEAKNDSQLKSFQQVFSEQDQTLDHLFANGLVWNKSPSSRSLVGVQVNHFACGGMAVGVSMSHAIGDGCTLGSFLNHWAAVARYGSTDDKQVLPLNPHFIQSPSTNSIQPKAHQVTTKNQGCSNLVTKKFVFPNTKLSDLKKKVIAAGPTQPITKAPTRVEVLTSLLYKTAVAAATTKSGCFKPSYLFMPVDIRNKFVQKLHATTVGNFLSIMMVPTKHNAGNSLSVIVAEIKNQKSQLEGIQSVQQAADNLKSLQMKLGNEGVEDLAERSYWCSCLCGIPYGKADFGWGKPMGVTMSSISGDKIGFQLTDTPDGDGIEALVILQKQDMEIFENDKEMISFCQIDQI